MKYLLLKYIFPILLITNLFSVVANNEKPPKKFVVVLDAGHGGHDSGNRGNGYFEKDIALDIILKTGKILEKNADVKVIYTRKTDVFIELGKRADIANKANADLFVSVHCNAHHSKAFGTETFVLGLHANKRNFDIAKKENSVILLEDDYKKNYDGFDPNSPESTIGLTLMQEEYLDRSLALASKIQDNFTDQLKRYNRGVKQAGFLVLHRTFMPSVLIETGFLTNKNEGKYLNSDQGKNQMAVSIAKAVSKYKTDVGQEYKETDLVVEVPKLEEKIKEKPTAKLNEKGVVFKVQISAGSTNIETSPNNFKGLSGISVKEEKGVFRYFYGSENNYNLVKELKKEAVTKGYKSCFIVAFKDGKRVPLSEVIN